MGAIPAHPDRDRHVALPGLFELLSPYCLSERPLVERYVTAHRFLAQLLGDAPIQIHEHFPDRPLVLDVITDPEADRPEHADHLSLRIVTDLDVAEAMRRLEAVEDAWWLHTLPQARGALSIDLAFV
jgi:hypothetical protein